MTKPKLILTLLASAIPLVIWFAIPVPMLLKMDTALAHWIAYGFSAFWIGLTIYIYWLITFRASRPA